MKRKLASIALMIALVLTMTVGSTTVSWAAGNLSSVESTIRTALNSYKAVETTSDGDPDVFRIRFAPCGYEEQRDRCIQTKI